MTSSPKYSSFAIRRASMADTEALLAIDTLCFPPGIAYPREEISRLLRNPQAKSVVAEQSGNIVGFAVAQRKTRIPERYGELITIDVLPQFRRHSLGREMYGALEKDLRCWGASRMQLQVSVENDAAIRFYRSLGYCTVRRIPSYYLGTIDAWHMQKMLS